MILKYKKFLESSEWVNIFNEKYFMKRIPPLKYFVNNSSGDSVSFKYYKNWGVSNPAILPLGDQGFIKFKDFWIDISFDYYFTRMRDFDAEDKLVEFKPMFKNNHYFIFNSIINFNLPDPGDIDELSKIIAMNMIKNHLDKNLKIIESFEVGDGDDIPSDKLDNIINTVNKNLFEIEDFIECKMKLSLDF